MAVDVEFLKSIPYFTGLSPEVLESIRQFIFEKKAQRGEIIVYEGEPARALYYVASGALKIFKTSAEGKEQILSIIRPKDSFNDVPVFDDGPNPASAQAMGPVVLCELKKNDLKILLYNYPQLAINTIRVLAGQIRNLVSLVEDLSFRHVISRVARILLEYAGDGASPGQRLTQQEMAAIAGSAREVVGRSLKTLEEDGIIRLDRHRIIIVNKEALKKMIESPL